MASKMLDIMRGLQARKVQLTVRYLGEDDLLLDGCKDAWQTARPTKLLEFAPFCAADHSPPGLDSVAHARTVLEGLNDLGVSGVALSPSGQDADCLIRGFFCGHRHLANVRAMIDGYWDDAEVGVRSWPGFTKNVRDMLITVLSAIVAATPEVSNSLRDLRREPVLGGGRYSLLHDEDAIHEVAVSEDLRASKAVRMGTERARIASVDCGSEDVHSGGDCSSGSGGSSQRRGATCPKKRKRKPSAASPRKVIDLSMSQADDGVDCGRAAIDLSMSQPEEGVDVSLLTSGLESVPDGGGVVPKGLDDGRIVFDAGFGTDLMKGKCDDVGAHCLADIFVDSSGLGGGSVDHQHESGSNVLVDLGSGFMESINVDVVSVASVEGYVGVDVWGLNADDIWTDASERWSALGGLGELGGLSELCKGSPEYFEKWPELVDLWSDAEDDEGSDDVMDACTDACWVDAMSDDCDEYADMFGDSIDGEDECVDGGEVLITMARTKKTARMETGGRKPAPPKKTNAPPTKTSKKAKIAPAKAVPAKTAPAKTKGSSKPQESKPGDSLPSRSVTSGSKRTREEDTSSLNSELLRQLVEANGIIKDLQASIKEKERNAALGVKDLGMRSHQTYRQCGQALSEFHANPQTYQMPADFLDKLMALNSPSTAQHKVQMKVSALVQECADGEGKPDEIVWNTLGLCAFDTPRNLIKSMQDTIWTLSVLYTSARAAGNFKTCFYAFWAYKAARDLYEVQWSALTKALGLEKAHELLIERRKRFGEISNDQWDKLVSLARGGKFEDACIALAPQIKRSLDYQKERAEAKDGRAVRCSHCGIEGHTADECYKGKNKNKRQRNSPKGDDKNALLNLLPLVSELDKAEKLGLIEFLQADQDQADFVSCINPFGVRIKPNGKARILVDPTITGEVHGIQTPRDSFNEHDVKATCDVYVDDYPIRADTHVDMQRAFEIMDREAELLGLEFNPSKDEGHTK
eukprot:gene2731-biopygen7888